MNLRRVGVLLSKELRQGAQSFIVIFAIVIPLVISLMVALVFGTLFEDQPRIGILDRGTSRLVALFQGQPYLKTKLYSDEQALRADTTAGIIDVALILPPEFDQAVKHNTPTDLTILFWGESNTTPRATLVFALAKHIVTLSERSVPVTVQATSLGSGEVVSWAERLLPLLILMSIILGGTLIPAVALVDEKAKRTLRALTVTPTTLLEVFVAKAFVGIIVSVVMALIILAVNQAWGEHPSSLLVTLMLGAVFAALCGLMLGSFAKTINGLFTMIKPLALILYAPAIIDLFPQLPSWLAKIFPTYYLLQPILEIAQNNANLGDILGLLAVLVGMIGVLAAGLVALTNHEQRREVLGI